MTLPAPGRALRKALFVLATLGLITTAEAGASSEASRPRAATCPPERTLPTPAQLQQYRANATEHGVLWQITRDGHSSYLYGSIHIGTAALAIPGPKMQQALRATDAMALELNLLDDGVQQAMKTALQAPLKVPVSAVTPDVQPLTAELLARLDRQRERLCMPAAQLAGMHPLMQAMTLTMESARYRGLDVMWAQEFMLAGLAKAQGRPITSLETPQSQMDALAPQSPSDTADALDKALRQLEDGSSERLMARMVEAWSHGRLDELARYDQWCGCTKTEAERALMRRLLDGRNPHLAEGIDRLHRQGQRVFAAVGALHMTGEQGLPLLLERRGYKVRRVF